MYSRPALLHSLALVAAGMLAWPNAATAQSFSADYALSRGAIESAQGAHLPGMISLGKVSVAAALHGGSDFAGGGLSVTAGQNWFAEVAVGRSLQTGLDPAALAARDTLRLAGGYRWTDGQSLFLELTGGRSGNRLGLAVSYDWPRYFVRLIYDTGINPVPQDNLRFSAGMRF
jgi:hypothetical protein